MTKSRDHDITIYRVFSKSFLFLDQICFIYSNINQIFNKYTNFIINILKQN